MAKTSFVRKQEEEPAAEADTGNTAVAVVEPAPPQYQPPATIPHDNQVEGEIDFQDINLDRINLVQKSGLIADEFSPGSFILGREIVIAEPKKEFNFVVLKIKKQYQQDTPYDPSGNSEKPLRFNTAQEVRAAGGSLKWGDENFYRDFATALILIPAPEGLSEDAIESKFIYEDADGKRYALALWSFIKTGYTAAAKKIFTAKLIGHLKAGLEHGLWSCSAEIKSNAGNSWHQPVIKPAGKTTEAFRAFAAEVVASLAAS